MDEVALLQLSRHLRDHQYRFITPTPATHALVNARPGNAQAQCLTDVFGWSRPFANGVLSEPLVALLRQSGALRPAGGRLSRSLVRLSTLDDMLFIHSAHPTDAPDAVFFGPDTYRYAAAITGWLDHSGSRVRRAVDIGCGAGPGALVIAKACPDAAVTGVDINGDALALTRVNAAAAGLGHVSAVHSDILSGVDGEFDLIVSNPPYLADPAERAYRHGGGELGAALSLAIVASGLARLAPGGTLLLYTGSAIVNGHDPFRAAVAERCGAAGVTWRYREVDPDVFGEELANEPYLSTDRIAAVVLTATKNG